MATDNRAEFILSFTGEDGGITALFNAFKKSAQSAVSELEQITNNIVLFKNLKSNLETARAAVEATGAQLTKLRSLAENADVPIGKELIKGLRDAERAANAANKEFDKQTAAVAKLELTLTAAGVDVKNLAAAEARLAVETKAAAAAQVEQQSKAALGFKTLKDVQPELNKLTAAYVSLRDSGKLSFGELSTLQARYQQSVAALNKEVGGLGQAFNEVRGRMIAFAALFAGVIAGAAKSAENFREFSTQLAAIGTIADVSEARLAELGRGVRALARDMGVDAVDSAKALYDIIGSGISPDNSLAVLEKAAKAARAGLTDVHTTAKIGVGILNAYHLRVDDLSHVYDVLFKTVKDGVVRMDELAKNIGTAIPAAVAAKVSIEELAASFVILTRNLIDAPEAATAIGKAIQDLSAPAPEAAAEMERLGFSFDGLVGSVKQLAALDLSADQINRLIPDVRAQRAIITLVRHYKDLNAEAREMVEQSGSFETAYARMADTPQAKIDRFNSSIKDLSISVGEFVSNGNGFVVMLTNFVKSFNELGPKTQQTIIQVVAFTAAATALSVLFTVLAPAINLMVGAFTAMGAASVTAAGGITGATIALGGLSIAIGGIVGFKFGELLYEWSAAVRVVGDSLGLLLASVDNMARTALKGLWAILTLNVGAMKELGSAFLANARDIAGEFWNVLTGTTEKTHNLAEKQKELAEQLKLTSSAATTAATNVNDAVGRLLGKLEAQQTAVESALTKVQARLQGAVNLLTKGVADISAIASQELTQLAADVATKLAALTTVDVQKVRDTVAIQKQAAQDRLQILAQFAVDAMNGFNALADSQRAIAIKSRVDLGTVDAEIALARKAKLTEIVAAFRDHVNQQLALYQGHLANIRALEEQRFGIVQSVDEKIRLLRQGGMTDYQKFQDNQREVDRLTARAKLELEAGNAKRAEEFAQRAIDLASTLGAAVTKDGAIVVSQFSAQEGAVRQITIAEDILLKANQKRTIAEKEGADAAAAKLKDAIPLLEKYEADLKRVTELAKVAILVQIGANTDKVLPDIDKLKELIEKREINLPLIANLTDANDAVQRFKDKLEKGGIPVELKPAMEKLDAAILKVQEAKPELTVETTAATAKVADLRTAVDKLATKITIDATVNSNVDDVQGKIDNLKKDTFSTHTVTVKTVNEAGAPVSAPVNTPFATGGLVGGIRTTAAALNRGGAVRTFARGGAVFRKPSWLKVPGQGSGDTVPAALQAGSFVVRKAASSYYGDGLMGALARGYGVKGYAGGGTVTKQEVAEWAKKNYGFDPFASDGAHPPSSPLPPPDFGGNFGGPNKNAPGFGGKPPDPVGLFGDKNPFGINVPGAGKGITDKSFQPTDPPVSFDTRPIPEILITAANVIAYASEMLNQVGVNNPLAASLAPAIVAGIAYVQRNPTDLAAIKRLLQTAETIGANPYLFEMWGKTASSAGKFDPTWFIDWLTRRGAVGADGKVSSQGVPTTNEAAVRFFNDALSGDFLKRFFGFNPSKKVNFRFGSGGSSSDTVPAMLTPGEFVIREPVVRRLGEGFFHAINTMQLPRAMLANILQPPMPRFFAEGGPVGGPISGESFQSGAASAGATLQVTFNIHTDLSETAVNKVIMPKIERSMKKAGLLP